MARFQFHLGFLSPSPLPHAVFVDVAEDEGVEGLNGNEFSDSLISSPLIPTAADEGECYRSQDRGQQFSIMSTVAAALRNSLVLCSFGNVEEGSGSSVDISWPTEVQHISHVTFDRFDGFLGLPLEFQPDIPSKVPSASINVFGVSAESMQCSHDSRGNSVPTILLSMQSHLYSQGGLQAEGIFRINAENGQEMVVREQLNKGIVPRGVDLHCLAGLIKAWFRELPTGVLDLLTPEQVMHCNTNEDCHQLVTLLPPTEAALLNWAINLMADVVEHEHHNKMNARNIAMVFAPNMTQMADPLTALIHAVQVMNFLKTLIVETLQERNRAVLEDEEDPVFVFSKLEGGSDADESFRSYEKSETEDTDNILEKCSPSITDSDAIKVGLKNIHDNGDGEGFSLNRLNLRKGVRRICGHSLFQLSKSNKKTGDTDVVVVNDVTETWA